MNSGNTAVKKAWYLPAAIIAAIVAAIGKVVHDHKQKAEKKAEKYKKLMSRR